MVSSDPDGAIRKNKKGVKPYEETGFSVAGADPVAWRGFPDFCRGSQKEDRYFHADPVPRTLEP